VGPLDAGLRDRSHRKPTVYPPTGDADGPPSTRARHPRQHRIRAYGEKFIARCWYRDTDGTTRKIERHGKTKTAARTRLHDALGQLRGVTTEPLRAHDRFEWASALWLKKVDAWVVDGELAIHHRRPLPPAPGLHRVASIGQLQLRECTRGRWTHSLRASLNRA